MLITWLPVPNYRDSIQTLSDEDLEVVRYDALILIEALHTVEHSELPEEGAQRISSEMGQGYITRSLDMWRGYETQLCEYGLEACEEWMVRAAKRPRPTMPVNEKVVDPLYDLLQQHMEWSVSDVSNMSKPPWFGDIAVHNSHKYALFCNDPVHYDQEFGLVVETPLLWPKSGFNG